MRLRVIWLSVVFTELLPSTIKRIEIDKKKVNLGDTANEHFDL
jgi:hypothetical protein